MVNSSVSVDVEVGYWKRRKIKGAGEQDPVDRRVMPCKSIMVGEHASCL